MIKERDFIFTGLQSWDITIGSNAKDIALEISKQNRVLYVNTPLDKINYHKNNQNTPETIRRKRVINKEVTTLREINPNLWVLDYPFAIWPVNKLPDGIIFDLANRMNNKKMYSFVKKIIKQLQFKDYILFTDNDLYRSFYAKDYLHPALAIYYRRDNMIGPFWERHIRRIEPLICSKYHCVLANSQELADAVSQHNKHTHNVGQGVDLSNYDTNRSYSIPNDIKSIPHPIIGYAGMLTHSRLDAQLVYDLAQQTKDYSYVFVGPEDTFFANHPLHTLPNVYFLGIKEMQIIPNYISAFDICMNPQLVNPATIGNYPRKVDEYLALGKPVVVTKTNTMSLFKDYIWICTDVADYKKAIQEILANNHHSNINGRVTFAHTHSWENSVNLIYSHIASLLGTTQK